MDKTEIVQATQSFTHGERIVRRGETFRAGHEVVKAHPEQFEAFRVENELETADAPPAKKRGGK